MQEDLVWYNIPVISIGSSQRELRELTHPMIVDSIQKPLRLNEMLRKIKAATESQYGILNRMVSMEALVP